MENRQQKADKLLQWALCLCNEMEEKGIRFPEKVELARSINDYFAEICNDSKSPELNWLICYTHC